MAIFRVHWVSNLGQIQWGAQTSLPRGASSSEWGRSSHQSTPWPSRRCPAALAGLHEPAGEHVWSWRSVARGKSHQSPEGREGTHTEVNHMARTCQSGKMWLFYLKNILFGVRFINYCSVNQNKARKLLCRESSINIMAHIHDSGELVIDFWGRSAI